MGLDMSIIKRSKGLDFGGREVGYWRKEKDLHLYFCSRLKHVDFDDYSFKVEKKDLELFAKDFIKIIGFLSNSLIKPEEKYKYYKEIMDIENYDDKYSDKLSLKVDEILFMLLYTLGTISFILNTTDFRSYNLYYEYSC